MQRSASQGVFGILFHQQQTTTASCMCPRCDFRSLSIPNTLFYIVKGFDNAYVNENRFRSVFQICEPVHVSPGMCGQHNLIAVNSSEIGKCNSNNSKKFQRNNELPASMMMVMVMAIIVFCSADFSSNSAHCRPFDRLTNGSFVSSYHLFSSRY